MMSSSNFGKPSTCVSTCRLWHLRHSLERFRRALLLSALFGVAISLQGCIDADAIVPVRIAKAWEAKPNYWVTYGYSTPLTGQVALGSCNVAAVPTEQKCSGHGTCKAWNATTSKAPLFFCACEIYWADPECRTPRKSQAKAYLLSLVGGFIGLDHFYLGEHFSGFIKLCTLGGFGFWWVFDIVRLGSTPVYANTDVPFRLAPDLDHGLYVFLTIGLFAALGYVVFGVYGARLAQNKRRDLLMNELEEDYFKSKDLTVDRLPPNPDEVYRIDYKEIVPCGLGDYSTFGRTQYRADWPQIVGGPYRNGEFYDAMMADLARSVEIHQ